METVRRRRASSLRGATSGDVTKAAFTAAAISARSTRMAPEGRRTKSLPSSCTNAPAMVASLAGVSEGGNGVARDPKRAAELYQPACKDGDGSGGSYSGALYLKGNGRRKNDK